MPTTLTFSEGHATTAVALLALGQAEALTLEDDFVESVNLADMLARHARKAGEKHAKLNAPDGPSIGRDAVLSAARDDGDVDGAALLAWLHADHVGRALASYRALDAAAILAARAVHRLIEVRASGWGKQLLDSLRDTLNRADRPARVMVDAQDFDFSDPSAVHRADRPVVQAFTALLPLAERCDMIREGAVALWQGAPDWATVEAFDGHGVIQRRANSLSAITWAFEPTGHPVARLVQAVQESYDLADEAVA